MHTYFLNIQSPKEKMHRCMVGKTVSNMETTVGLHQQVQILVIKTTVLGKLGSHKPTSTLTNLNGAEVYNSMRKNALTQHRF